MMTTTVDVIVLGTGSAAQNVAYACRASGWSVAVVDSRPFGGTCALRGCDPKKVLVGVAELVDWSRRMQGKGIRAHRTWLCRGRNHHATWARPLRGPDYHPGG